MYSRAVRALAALMLCCAAPASAITLEQQQRPAEPVNRTVHITSSDLISIQSFYQRRAADRAPGSAASSEPRHQQLWGFTADSTLPASAVRAQLEYSVWLPPAGGGNGIPDDRNRLVRLQLNDHRRYVDYGANLFAVGDAFAQNPLARERLNAAGVPGVGEGREFWVAGRVPGLELQPRFRRLEKSQGASNLLDESVGVAYGHGFGTTRLTYLLESSQSSTWFEEASAAAFARTAAAATVRMMAPDWNLYLKGLRFDEEFNAARRETGSIWELGGTLNMFSGLSLSPMITDQMRDLGSEDWRHATSARLTLHTTWIEPMAVNLQLQRNWRETGSGETFAATAADLQLRTPLRLWERVPHNLTMTASLGYRGMQGLMVPAPEEGVSFRLTFDFRPGG